MCFYSISYNKMQEQDELIKEHDINVDDEETAESDIDYGEDSDVSDDDDEGGEFNFQDGMPQMVDLLTSDDGDNIVEAITKALNGIQHAVESNTEQLVKVSQQIRAIRKLQ